MGWGSVERFGSVVTGRESALGSLPHPALSPDGGEGSNEFESLTPEGGEGRVRGRVMSNTRTSPAAYARDFWSATSSFKPLGTVTTPRMIFWTVATAFVSYSPYHGSL